jgi:glyoxylase-like metal-dependent hydrolase (beta-lactamase superfamily II)
VNARNKYLLPQIILGLLAIGPAPGSADTGTCPPQPRKAQLKAPAAETANRPSGATTSVYDFKSLKVHAYTAPKQALRTSSYVIEGPSKLVVIEPQFMNSLSKDFRAYVDGLGKPVERVLVTDRDPDHYFGLAAGFTDTPAYALASVISVIDKEGPALLEERRKIFGEEMPKQQVAPSHALETGRAAIDCVNYQFDASTDDEGGQQLAISLPDYGVIATGDIALNHCHLVPGTATETRLKSYAKDAKAYTLVLPSNGVPASGKLFGENLDYLKKVKINLQKAKTAEEYQKSMTAAYPGYDCDIYFMFYVPAHFQKR